MEKKNLYASKMIRKCPECGSTRLMKYYEDIVCMDCSFVVTSKSAEQSSEQNYDGKQRKRITRPSLFQTSPIHRKELSVAITGEGNNVHEKGIILDQKANISENWQKFIKVSDSTERNLAVALFEITRIAEALSLPKIVLEVASAIYKTTVEKRIIEGRSILALSSAVVYIACRQCGIALTIHDVASTSKINRRKVGRSCSFLMRELNFSIPPLKPSQYLSHLSNRLTMQEKPEKVAKKILRVEEELNLSSGKNPVGVAAAASYIASVLTGEKKTQREIAEASRITEATIRNRYKELSKQLLFTIAL